MRTIHGKLLTELHDGISLMICFNNFDDIKWISSHQNRWGIKFQKETSTSNWFPIINTHATLHNVLPDTYDVYIPSHQKPIHEWTEHSHSKGTHNSTQPTHTCFTTITSYPSFQSCGKEKQGWRWKVCLLSKRQTLKIPFHFFFRFRTKEKNPINKFG